MTGMQSTDTTGSICIPYIDRPVLEHIYTHLNPNHCDVVFVVNGEKFPTHSFILGGASDFFTSMVEDHFKETATKEIPLNIKYTKAFAGVLEYIHGISIQIFTLTIEEIAEMLDLATKFNLPKLRKHIAGYLSNYTDVTLDCAVLLINTARQYQLGSLTERVKSFLYDESKNLLVHESFVQIQDKIVLELFESDHFYTKEIDILHAALKWIDANLTGSFLNSTTHQLHSPSTDDMRSNTRRELETSDQAETSLILSKALLLRTIRFSNISMDDFFKVSKSDLFVKYTDLIYTYARKSKSRKRRGDCHGVITLTVKHVDCETCGYEEKSETISLGNGHKFWIEVQQLQNCKALEIVPKMDNEKETKCTTTRLSIILKAKDKFGKDYYVTRENLLEKYREEIESEKGSGNTEDRSDSSHNKTTDCESNRDIENEEEGNSNEESNDEKSDESESNSECNPDESIQETELDLLVGDDKNENYCEGNSGDIDDEKEGNSNEESSEQNSDESDESNSEYNPDESIQKTELDLLVEDAKNENYCEGNSGDIDDEKEGNSNEESSEQNSDESDESNSEYNPDESIQKTELDLHVEDAKNENYCEGNSGDIDDEKEGNSNKESSEQNSDESDESNSEYNPDESIQKTELDLLVEDAKNENLNYCEAQDHGIRLSHDILFSDQFICEDDSYTLQFHVEFRCFCERTGRKSA